MPLDYETLRIIWWLLLGVLLIGFAVMDGFDLGALALSPFVARTDTERRIVLNAIGPVWEGNQVWLVLGGGAIFAAWPALYAAAFSGFYIAMFLVLLALIARPVGITFRSKRDDPRWRALWDWVLAGSGAVAALVFGVAVGNVLQGVPFRLDALRLPIYEGSFLGLFNPFALLAGIISLAMMVMHGAAWIAAKSDGGLAARARRVGIICALALLVLFTLAGLWVAFGIDGYRITSAIDPAGPSDPLAKTVARAAGAWLANYRAWPIAIVVPGLAYLGMLGALACFARGWDRLCMVTSAAATAGIVATPGVAMFPFIMPSSIEPRASLTVWDASSSHLTLFIMFVATAVFMPIILAYTAWVFRVLRGKLDAGQVEGSDSSY